MFVFIFVTASLHTGAPLVGLQWVLFFKVIGDATTFFILKTFKKN